MHPRSRRAARRPSAPSPPKRRRSSAPARNPFLRPTSGFEGLIPADGSEDFFFSGFVQDPDEAAEFLEHGESRESIASDPKLGVTASAGLHIFMVLFLLIEPSLSLLGKRDEPDGAADVEQEEPLMAFIEEPPAEPPPPVVTVVPVPPAQAQPPPAPTPPQTADERMLIPKAMLPSEKPQEFMNDLPFSEGNTDEFYTDEEVKDPGKEGETEKAPEPEEPAMVAESGEDDEFSEESEGTDVGNDGIEKPETRLDPEEVAELLFGDPRARETARPRDVRPPEPKPAPNEGEGGENGAFTDIRRFLAGSRFENPEGGLVANTGNTLYYNDKGANFVPWIRRMLAEVRRNWFVPYSVAFNHGHVAVGISVARDGTVTDLRILIPSGISGFDNAAVGALRAAQLLPLPADYPDDRFEIILVFWYNERPYDLFG
ncbi:MAG: TonB family protein [Vicinamibacteria bacterium]